MIANDSHVRRLAMVVVASLLFLLYQQQKDIRSYMAAVTSMERMVQKTFIRYTTAADEQELAQVTDFEYEVKMEVIDRKLSQCEPHPVEGYRFQPVPLDDCSSPYVTINDGARLGNIVCQYMALYLIRHLYGVRVAVTPKMNASLNMFQPLAFPVASYTCHTDQVKSVTYDVFMSLMHQASLEKGAGGRQVVQPLLSDSYYINNCPCPRGTILRYRDLIRKALRYRPEVLQATNDTIQKALTLKGRSALSARPPLVAVHVRRTDYLGYIHGRYNLPPLNKLYFKRAFQFFRKRLSQPVFLVVSDDITWCKANLKENDVVVIDDSLGRRRNTDLALMAVANHSIMSYGTFGFTGVALGAGDVVSPYSLNKTAKYHVFDCVNNTQLHFISSDADYRLDSHTVTTNTTKANTT